MDAAGRRQHPDAPETIRVAEAGGGRTVRRGGTEKSVEREGQSPGRQGVLHAAPHHSADVGLLGRGRRDGRVGHGRDVVTEGRAGENGSDEHGRIGVERRCGRVEERRRQDHGSEARPGGRRNERADQEGHTHEAAAADARRRRQGDQALHEPARAHERSKDSCQDPGEHHEHDDRPAHASDDRLGVRTRVAGEQRSQRDGRQEDGPEPAFVGGAREPEPRHAGQKERQGGERARCAQAEVEARVGRAGVGRGLGVRNRHACRTDLPLDVVE